MPALGRLMLAQAIGGPRPYPAAPYSEDRRLGDSVSSRQASAGFGGYEDCDRIGGAQSRAPISLAVRFQSDGPGVRVVRGFGEVFQITRAIVALVSVLVIDIVIRWAGTDERRGDESMNLRRFVAAPSPAGQIEMHAQVSAQLYGLEYSPAERPDVQAADATIVRHFVQIREWFDRNWAPFHALYFNGKRVAIFLPL